MRTRDGSGCRRPRRARAAAWAAAWAVALAVALAAAPAFGAGEDFATRLEATWRAQLLRALSGGGAQAPRVSASSDAAGGCDGVKNGQFGFHTGQDKQPWWQVDLGRAVPLGRVVVYNRCTVSERAAKLSVLVSDDGKSWKRVYRHDGPITPASIGAHSSTPHATWSHASRCVRSPIIASLTTTVTVK